MDGIQMEPIGKYKADRNGSAKAAAWRNMIDQDLDDVAFLADSEKNRALSDGAAPLAVCSLRRALCVTASVLACMLATALIAVLAAPAHDCPCAEDLSVIPKTPPPDTDTTADSNKERISTSGAVFPWRGARLPTFVIPRHYSLWLHPNLTTGELRGEVSIELKVDRDTTFVVLNVRDMNVSERALFKGSAIGPRILRVLDYPPAEQSYIEFKDKLRRKFNYTLSLRFITKLEKDDKLRGFFMAGSYKNRCAVSRFWLTHARSAFPCFDEPHFRATFKLTVVRDRFHVSLTNMPIVATEEAGFYLGHRLLQDEFATTPPMSPYMMSLAVCRMQRRAAPPVAPFVLGTNTLFTSHPPAQSQTTQLPKTTTVTYDSSTGIDNGLDIEVEDLPPPEISLYSDQQQILDDSGPLLEWIQKTIQQFAFELNTSYPLPKLDLVVIEGANPYSEGWGLITLTPASLSDSKTIARLLAQQWFGGLVSPRWWSSQWLMLALTSVLAERAPAPRAAPSDGTSPSRAAPPDGTAPPQSAGTVESALLLDHVLPALRLDAGSTVRAVSSPRLDRADIESTTDELSLHKGAAIVSMAIEACGGAAGRLALSRLLRVHRFASADAADLWRALQLNRLESNQSAQNPPPKAWDAWCDRPGYPLLIARPKGPDVLVTQERFLMTAEPPEKEPRFLYDLLTIDLRADLDELFYEPENITEFYEDENSTSTTPPPTTTTKRPKTTKPPPAPKWIIPLTFIVGPVYSKYREDSVKRKVVINDNAVNGSQLGNNSWSETGNETITLGSRWAENVTHLIWMNDTELIIPDLGKHTWVRYNVGARGLYRVAPQDPFEGESMESTVNRTLAQYRVGSAAERALTLDDAFVLSRAQRLSAARALAIAVRLKDSSEWAPWQVVLNHLSTWRQLLADSAVGPQLCQLLATLRFPRLDGDQTNSWLKGALLTAGVEWGNPEVTEKAVKLFDAWFNRNETIPEYYLEGALTAGVRARGAAARRGVWARGVLGGARGGARGGRAAPHGARARAALAALCAAADDNDHYRFAWTILSSEAQRGSEWKQWVTILFQGTCRWHGPVAVWRLLSSGVELPPSALAAAAHCLRHPHDYHRFAEMFGVNRHTQPALDTIALNVAWSKRAEVDLLRYFQYHDSNQTAATLTPSSG